MPPSPGVGQFRSARWCYVPNSGDGPSSAHCGVAQAAAFLYCFQIHSRTNFSVSVFHARFHVSHFSTSPSDRKASPSSVDTASQRCARFLDNKQVSQAEILENYQALPFCSRVSKRQRARSRYSCEHFRDHHKVLCCSRVSMTT